MRRKALQAGRPPPEGGEGKPPSGYL
jgi:hypothetical protein